MFFFVSFKDNNPPRSTLQVCLKALSLSLSPEGLGWDGKKFPNFVAMYNPRKLLYPFSLLYGGIMSLRNKLYDHKIFHSRAFDIPVIAVGNLSTGGTGKSPMIEYLIELLKGEYRVATLSRGYKRKTTGFHLLDGTETAEEVGDEPLQFKTKFPNVAVAVDEDRVHGIQELLEKLKPEVLLLDDAFQHRKVKAGLSILLTPYNNLYCDDLVLPAGNLRESNTGAARAEVVVVTKCPEILQDKEMDTIRKKLRLEDHQHLFFSRIEYADKISGANETIFLKDLQKRHFTLVTGIANPGPLVSFLQRQELTFDHQAFPDHHNFTASELNKLKKKKLIVTTEKDYMRLKNDILEGQLFYLSIKSGFVENSSLFKELILDFAQKK